MVEAPHKSPSQYAKAFEYAKHQQQKNTLIYDGRYASDPTGKALTYMAAAPIEIYHPVFAFFQAQAQRGEPAELDESIVQETYKLMRATSEIFSLEKRRQEFTQRFLQDVLEFGVIQMSANGGIPDHSIPVNISSRMNSTGEYVYGVAVVGIGEEKAEIGESGDAVQQAGCSYQSYWKAPALAVSDS